MKRAILAILILLFHAYVCDAQTFVVKTNALYWATTTPNVGLEVAVAPRWTLSLKGGYNPWTLDAKKNIKAKHVLVTPEARYWFCESFLGHFISLHANGTYFNVGGIPLFEDARRQGWAVGAGLGYGCSWPIARRWNIEANIGFGVWYTQYDSYQTKICGLFNETIHKFAFAPTSLGLSFIYIIK